MITFPNAKINLGLNIIAKRSDGYHNLETIFYPVSLEEALEVNKSENNSTPFALHTSGLPVEGDPAQNLVAKAFQLLAKRFDLPPIDVYLYKKIPTGAGLGGGSSDAAFMLKLLNDEFELKLTTEELEEYAAQLGADCAFFIRNHPTFAEGIGNIFSSVKVSLQGYGIVIVKPDIFVSTREAFSLITPAKPEISLKENIYRAPEEWKKHITNDFERSVFKLYPAIAEIKDKLYDHGAIYASMSGSGAAVYGLFTPKTEIPEMDFGSSFFYQSILK